MLFHNAAIPVHDDDCAMRYRSLARSRDNFADENGNQASHFRLTVGPEAPRRNFIVSRDDLISAFDKYARLVF